MTNASSFVPVGFLGASWTHIQPLVEQLKQRPVSSASDLEQWLMDRSDLEAACSEARANLYIATSCNTEDAAISAAYTRYLEEVGPKLEVAAFELDRRQVEMHALYPLSRERYEVLQRSKKASVELFRDENVPIQTELAKLSQDYGKITGAQTVVFDGQERTLPQMTQYLLRPDRSVREGAWKGIAERRLKDRAALDDLLDQMVSRRHALATNAGCASYVEFAFKEKQRFDYAPKDCETFWNAVAKHVVPLMRRLDAQRQATMGVDELRPWDLSVDVKGRPGLRPFDGGRELMDKTQSVMDALDGRLGKMTRRLGGSGESGSGAPSPMSGSKSRAAQDEDKALVTECLDLDSRKGKRPGGYQYVRDLSRKPFIFMNAAGLHRDVMTMVHEVGHAFHSMLAEKDPLVDYRHSPIEFAEVASMSMEHLTMPHWGVRGGFYDKDEDLRRARKEHLEDSITILAWIATIDAFQHWMYRNPKHTHVQRDAHWLTLDERFGHAVSWRGLESSRESQWQRQGHLYSHPMYYIEYGIAQLGALGLWLKSRREGQKAAVDAYVKALTLGGSQPLPQLFEAAGLSFEFGEKPVAAVVDAVEAELASLRE
jgi:oligoendopeptidase F